MISMKIALTGDAMLGRLVDEHILAFGPEYPLHDIEPLLARADFALANLECTIARGGVPFPNRAFYFRAHPAAAKVLKRANIKCVSLANNHMMDFGPEALLETVRHLDAAGISHAGAGANLEEAEKPAVAAVGGLKIAVLSFADHFKEYAASEKRPGINYAEIATRGEHWDRITNLVGEARKAADTLIFSIHWGPNMRARPTSQFVEFAHAVMDLGVDVFHGHSAHIFQGIEVYGGRPIFYDTGELVDDYYVGSEKNDQQLLFFLEMEGRKIISIELVPIHISLCRTAMATGKISDEILARIKSLSEEFRTRIARKNGAAEAEL